MVRSLAIEDLGVFLALTQQLTTIHNFSSRGLFDVLFWLLLAPYTYILT